MNSVNLFLLLSKQLLINALNQNICAKHISGYISCSVSETTLKTKETAINYFFFRRMD